METVLTDQEDLDRIDREIAKLKTEMLGLPIYGVRWQRLQASLDECEKARAFALQQIQSK